MGTEFESRVMVPHGGADVGPGAEHSKTLPELPLLQTISKSPKASNASPPELLQEALVICWYGKGDELVPVRLANLHTPPGVFTNASPE